MIDTGSWMMVLANSYCQTCTGVVDFMNTAKSSTFELLYGGEGMELPYAGGIVYAQVFSDTVSLGGMSIPEMWGFLMYYSEADISFDGIAGMGFAYEAVDLSLLGSLYAAGLIAEPIFSMKWLNSTAGQFNIGGIPSEITQSYSNYITCPVFTGDIYGEPNQSWVCGFSQMSIGNTAFTSYSPYVNIDSGTTMFLAPEEDIVYFMETYFDTNLCIGPPFLCGSAYNVNAQPSLSFTINGYNFIIPPSLLFSNYEGAWTFNIGFMTGTTWVLGQQFMQNFHVVFDGQHSEVGFLPESNGSVKVTPVA